MYRGWWVVVAAFVVMFLGFGCAYSFTAFFPELQKEFDASHATVSLVFSTAGFLYFGLGAVSGLIADRMGPRWVSAAGMALVGIGLAVASLATELTMLYVGFLIGIGVGVGFSYVPSIGAVQPWFTAHRGLASGLAVSGIGFGTFIGPIAASAAIEAAGWRSTLFTFGVVAAIGGVAASLFLRNDPRGFERQDNAESSASSVYGLSLGEAVRTRPFWLLYLGALFVAIGIFIPFVHLVPYALSQGFEVADGAYVLGAVGVGSTLGRFLVGGIADKIGRERALLGAYAGITAMLFVWLCSETLSVLYVFALVFGICYGSFVALAPAVCADFFGTRAASSIIGVLYTSVAIGTLVGPSLAGFVFDKVGNYTSAILFGEAMAGLAVLLTVRLPRASAWNAHRVSVSRLR